MNKVFKNKFFLAFLGVIFILGISLYPYYVKHKKEAKSISYPIFTQQLKEHKIKNVYISYDENLQGTLKDGSKISFPNPRVENFKEQLLVSGVEVVEKYEQGAVSEIFSTLFIIGLVLGGIYFLNKRMGKSVNKEMHSIANVQTEELNQVNTRFDDIAGNEEAKESVQELIDFIKSPEKYIKYGARMPRGVIFYGPPGTGKTLMAKAIAGEAGVPYFAVSGSDFVQMYVGVGAARIRALFKKAQKAGKCVIFIDEIDAVGKKREGSGPGSNDERDQTLNALLTEMSGFNENEGIIVIAATNRLDILDDALLRPGRFDRHIEIGLPDANAREKILKLYVKNKPVSEEVNIRKLAEQAVYFSGAQLESLMNEAAIFAARRNAKMIELKDVDKAFYTVIAGAEKKDRSGISNKEREITAYHEAGHALITKLISKDHRVTKVTIIPSTKGAGGYSMNIPPDKMYETKAEMENEIKISLAGRIAEELIFGENEITTGASNDIQKATRTLKYYMERFGMSKKLGLLNYDEIFGNGYTREMDAERLQEYKEKMDQLYIDTKGLMIENKYCLTKIADALLKKETLQEEEINAIMQGEDIFSADHKEDRDTAGEVKGEFITA